MDATTTNARAGLMERLIMACVRHPYVTILFTAAACVWGWYSLRHAPLDAVPDLSDVQVIIVTEWPGRSPDLVEDQITYPISSALLAAPRVNFVRGQSYFGTSFVYIVFEDGTDIYWARSRVLEYLNTATAGLPEGVTPRIGPDATAIGWVYQYALVDTTGELGLQGLRSLQDWHVRYALESVDGVAEVATVGGFVKQYQVNVDPDRLRSYGIPLSRVIEAVRASNEDAGGRVIEIAGHEHIVRGRGYIRDVADLEASVLVTGAGGVPVRVADVATVTLGPDIRRGVAELNGEGEVVGGIVIMRYGENALRVIDAVKKRIDDVRVGLPAGVELKVVYDRSDLIERSVRTLWHTLAEEMIVVSLIIFLFLMHVRSALVAIITLPVAVLLAFIPMFYQNLTINIMSLGGIAVAIGAMVDASIIIVENVHKRLEEWEDTGRPVGRTSAVASAITDVGPSIFFSLVVIAVSFLPVFTLEATEGRLFRPLAFTKTYSMGFAAVLAVTLAPALAAILIRGRMRREEHNPLNRWLIRAYAPVVRWVVRWRYAVVVVSVVLLAATVPVFLTLDSEFMPPLNEGAVLAMPTSPPGMSITEAANVVQTMDRILSELPEVESVFGKMGRAETATDPAPLSMAEITIMLKPRKEWRPGMTWEKLIDEMDAAVKVPGMPNLWWMPIQTRIEMLTTGIRSPLGIQVFGPDLATIERTAVDIERAVMGIPGTRSAFAERSTGGFFIDFTVKRDAAARYGLSVRDINDVVQSAIGGMNVTQTVEGRERYPVNVRFAREWRDNPEALQRVLIHTPTGEDIPISTVADVEFVSGPPMVRSEDGQLVTFVFVDIGERAIGNYVKEAKRVVAANVDVPAGVRLAWTGQYRYLERAMQRLRIVLPVTLLLVALLLYLIRRSVIETGIVMLTAPFALIGSVWLLWAAGFHLSVAVWVGVIALLGVAAETGVVMLLYLNLAIERWKRDGRLQSFADLKDAIVEGAARRIRPKFMAVMTTTLGLMPLMWGTGAGADMMKRIAAPMVGGLTTSFLMELLLYPAIYAIWKGRGLHR